MAAARYTPAPRFTPGLQSNGFTNIPRRRCFIATKLGGASFHLLLQISNNVTHTAHGI